ncbi:hypothetical protein [Hoeflea prorocentri]|uniref:DUF4189 domain-containing protein n=1 Tax=Hoeflea prorocentri TaxID=1922333 RepID=A0A9X3UFP1_9HYPH|nr:hypothetical protein [Hoeflea prorocentri]MCY6380035.1 hypothetical protein [Hoeflea prorocentri]MDA5397835.1 hypothetical protein [Hoeflea prorocentri]
MSAPKVALCCFLAALLTACTTSAPPPPGDSLAGWKGNVRRTLATGARGSCPDAIKKYIEAKGHSAYASTEPLASAYEGKMFICGSALNRKSTAEAEALAMRNCEAGTKKWKHAYVGKCTIHASK